MEAKETSDQILSLYHVGRGYNPGISIFGMDFYMVMG
jgi:hypothetical protein